MKNLKITTFLKENENWRELLSKDPYNIKIKEDGDYILLKYDQIFSDFNNEIVRECRGIIFDKNYTPVCVPFFKFGNYGESYCDKIDWESAKVLEKIDGMLIKVWYHNNTWHISTNGTIDAFKAEINHTFDDNESYFQTYGELFMEAKKVCGLDFDKLNKNHTYMFELTSPFAKVVVQYEDTKIYHIGTRDNTTLEELDENIGIEKPQTYSFRSLEDCINTARLMPYNQEGYVVVDKNWHRVKVKSTKYIIVHRLKNNGEINKNSLMVLIRENETEEFLTYFTEYRPYVEEIKTKINKIFKEIESGIKILEQKQFANQKEFALEVTKMKYSSFYFAWRKNKNLKPYEWFWSFDNSRLIELYKL